LTFFQRLSDHFEVVAEKMAELEFYNPALSVAVVVGETCEQGAIAVLVTPWCMNLVLLPPAPQDYGAALVGTKQLLSFPSGTYEFLYSGTPELGAYWVCSLFSPVTEFIDQEAAELTAQEVLKAIFQAENCGKTDRQLALQAQREEQQNELQQQSSAITKRKEGLSRRQFLTATLADER